jgi:hypothetical protein
MMTTCTSLPFNKFFNIESVHWFRWHKGHGGDSQAGHWLNVIPKYQKFYMDPLDFRTSLRHYLYFTLLLKNLLKGKLLYVVIIQRWILMVIIWEQGV